MANWLNAPLIAVTTVVLGGVLSAGCESSHASSPRATRHELSAKTVCGRGLQREIAVSLGVASFRVTQPRAARGVTSCQYRASGGAIALSVARSSDATAAVNYVERLSRRGGRRPESPQFGDGLDALMTTDGSVVVRKGREVLLVDVGALPPRFGNPGQAPNVVALAVATTIVGHWSPG